MHIDACFCRISGIEHLPIVHCLLLLLFNSPERIFLPPDFTLLILLGHLLNEFDEIGGYFRIGLKVAEL
jgi:hypothetical protein